MGLVGILNGVVWVIDGFAPALLAYGAYLALGGGRYLERIPEDDAHPRRGVGRQSQ